MPDIPDPADIAAQPYAGFLEDFLHNLVELGEPMSIGVCVLMKDGRTLTGYWEASPNDKAVFAHQFQADAILDEIEANGAWLRSVIDNADGEDPAEDEEEDPGLRHLH